MSVDPSRHSDRARPWLWAVGLIALLAGGVWLALVCQTRSVAPEPPTPIQASELQSGVAATLDSPPFLFSPGWQVSREGAGPTEPMHPFDEPAGVVTFAYTGRELALQIAPGDYWAYLYATVDGRPANLLPPIGDNEDSQGNPAGYKTLYAPERVQDDSNPGYWLRLHRAEADTVDGQPHAVRIELWRGWDQTPLRAAGVDILPGEPLPWWPGVLLAIVGAWVFVAGFWNTDKHGFSRLPVVATNPCSSVFIRVPIPVAGIGVGLLAVGIALSQWWLCAVGVVMLALAGVIRPALWVAALLLALPFYFGVKLPLLPGRFFSLIDLGIFGGLGIVAAHWLLARMTGWAPSGADTRRSSGLSLQSATYLLLAALISWALIAVFDARFPALALREWRVVFLNAGLFAVLLAAVLRLSPRAESDRQLLVFAWLLGAAVVSLFGLWGYIAGGPFVSQAEGVRRVQAFYGSPNNLALYLDRTLAVSLALALFVHARRERWLWAALTVPQALAYFLTFSKGSLFLALPAMLLVLAAGGFWLLRREGRSTRLLWGMALVAMIGVLVLAPSAGTERFQQLFNLSGGTGFIRLQLWRSAWQMALDHTWLGVGPDNFLYAYRSDYLLPAAWQEPNLNHPHNLFLDWWTRLGLTGLVLGLGWMAAGIAVIVRQLRTGPRPALALGLLAAAAAALAHGLIDVSYALPDLMIVWVLMLGIDPAR